MKAALTGWAWRTPLGASREDVMHRLWTGEHAVGANARFDASHYACRVAASLPMAPQPSRHQRFLRRMGLFAVEVAVEAMAHAQQVGGERVGLFFGYGGLRAHWDDMMPAFEHQQPDGHDAWASGLSLLHPFWMLQHLSNNAHAIAAQTLMARGEGSVFAGANGGAQAMAGAIRALHADAVDAALVVGYDSLVEPETLVALAQRGDLTRDSFDQWLAPYGVSARGFVPGEAAAAVVLRRPGDSDRTLAHVQAADAADGAQGAAGIATLARIALPLAQAGDAVDGAGLAQSDKDTAERAALGPRVGTDAPLGCIASAMGQLGAATSVVQAIALSECLRHGRLMPIAGRGHAADGPLRPLRRAEPTTRRAAIGLALGAPGLAGVVRVSLP